MTSWRSCAGATRWLSIVERAKLRTRKRASGDWERIAPDARAIESRAGRSKVVPECQVVREMSSTSSSTRVVIVGAGFGGLNAASRLENSPVEVLVIDRYNFHTFQPLLYQVATAGLEPEEIAHAVRGIFQKQRNVSFRLGEVVNVLPGEKQVELLGGDRIAFDYLILSAGATTSFFGVDGAEEHSFSLKSLLDATRLRSHLIRQFEAVDRDPTRIDDGALNFVVVGGGPTGVEMAGALVELFDLVLRKDYPSLPIERARVILVEMQDRLLGAFHEKLQRYALKTLLKRNVEVLLETGVDRVTASAVHLNDGSTIPTNTVIWAAGVRGEPIGGRIGSNLETGPAGRVILNEDLSVPGHEDIFVIGDLAGSTDDNDDLHPQLAPVAIQGGKYVAAVIDRRLRGRTAQEPFSYKDKGIMATIGRNAAVAELGGGIRTRGFSAWLMWLFLHLVMLVGFRNRVNVLVNWAWNYFTYDRSARLILDDEPVSRERPD